MPVADSARPSPTTLPTDTYGPGSVIVVDIDYTYLPLVANRFLSGIQIKRSFYIQPRYVSVVTYQPDDGGMATSCP